MNELLIDVLKISLGVMGCNVGLKSKMLLIDIEKRNSIRYLFDFLKFDECLWFNA